MKAGFRAILVDTSGADKQWDSLKLSKLPTAGKTGGTLCCTAGGAVSLEPPNHAQLPDARPCLSQNSTDLLFHFFYFKSFLFHEEK